MNKMKKKLGGADKGFTLVEMLIVVAIIAILIAISIPLINSALEKAKHATDAANERAAKAIILIASLEGKLDDGTTDFKPSATYAYDAKNGKLVESNSSSSDTVTTYGQHKTHAGQIILVKMLNDQVAMNWGAMKSEVSADAPKTLCSNVAVKDAHSGS